jgi:xylose isomerase
LPEQERSQVFAARLNSFKVGAEVYWPGKNRITTADLLARAASVPGLNSADLNFPDHFEHASAAELQKVMADNGIALNGLAMRYYTDPGFKLGAFTHPDSRIRQAAIDVTRRGIDTLRSMGGRLMTLWMGQDGFDYSFQADYRQVWDTTIEALQAVCAHDKQVDIAIEYKPNEPRSFALMPDIGTTLLAIREAGDFAHVLYADEMPAHAAYLASRHSRVLGVHLNDGYGKRDDGLMAASVHPVQTLELLVTLRRVGYSGAIYFDTFPDHSGLDPVAECSTNIAVVLRLQEIAASLADDQALAAAIARQDAPASQAIVNRALYGQS